MVRLKKRYKCLLIFVWVVVVLYPNPSLLVTTIARSISPPVDPVAVRGISAELPDNPKQIEHLVLTEYVPYAYDWAVYGVPWYFPTPAEVLRDRRGDCESRAVLLASILDDKQIPYEFNLSPVHIWVKYEGKLENTVESDAVAFVEHRDGVYRLKVPEKVDLKEYIRIEAESLWDVMPAKRKVLLFGGIAFLLVVDFLLAVVVTRFGRKRDLPVATQGAKSA